MSEQNNPLNGTAAETAAETFAERYERIRAEIAREMIGQREVVEHLLLAVIAGGNVLLEGVPGLGKTHLVRVLGKVLNLPFSRIQFTPDLMPADITGTNILVRTEEGNAFRFQEGPLFSSIVLADEINRATPKTQAALLEAMQEHAVTVAGETRKLPEPYFVLATQNPVEQEGTYPLPEAQLDRFLPRRRVRWPARRNCWGCGRRPAPCPWLPVCRNMPCASSWRPIRRARTRRKYRGNFSASGPVPGRRRPCCRFRGCAPWPGGGSTWPLRISASRRLPA